MTYIVVQYTQYSTILLIKFITHDNLQGAQQGFWEIFGNGADEHSAGHGNEFDVIKHKDGKKVSYENIM